MKRSKRDDTNGQSVYALRDQKNLHLIAIWTILRLKYIIQTYELDIWMTMALEIIIIVYSMEKMNIMSGKSHDRQRNQKKKCIK